MGADSRMADTGARTWSPMSHDQNFKNLILDYPRQAIAFAAASEATRL